MPSWTRDDCLPAPGSTGYASPERAPGVAPSAPDDVFAAGVVLFELATGLRPCGPERPSDLDPTLAPPLDEAYARLCARAERRQAARDAAALLHGLAAARRGAPSAPPAEPPAAVRLPPRAHFVGPVAPGCTVRVRLPGGEHVLPVTGADRPRAALLGPTPDGAGLAVLGPAPVREWERLLAHLPTCHAVAVLEAGASAFTALAGPDVGRLCPGEPCVVWLCRDVHALDRLRCARHGATLLYRSHDPMADVTRVAAARDALRAGAAPAPDTAADLRAAFDAARRGRPPAPLPPCFPAARLAGGGGLDLDTLPAE